MIQVADFRASCTTVNATPGFADAICEALAHLMAMLNDSALTYAEIDGIKNKKDADVADIKKRCGDYVSEGHAVDGLSMGTVGLLVGSILFPPALIAVAVSGITSVGVNIAENIHGTQLNDAKKALVVENPPWLGQARVASFVAAAHKLREFTSTHSVDREFFAHVLSAVAVASDADRLRQDDHAFKVNAVRTVLRSDFRSNSLNFVFISNFMTTYLRQVEEIVFPQMYAGRNIVKREESKKDTIDALDKWSAQWDGHLNMLIGVLNGFADDWRQAQERDELELWAGQGLPWDDHNLLMRRIDAARLVKSERIRLGASAEVYAGLLDGQRVAIKQLCEGQFQVEADEQRDRVLKFFQEIELTARLEHPHIVAFIGISWTTPLTVCLVTEYMAGLDLRTLLDSFPSDRPQGFDQQKATLALHIAEALVYLHSLAPRVLHRDLKSTNILLDETRRHAKLADFGVACAQNDTAVRSAIGTRLWMAPEVLCGNPHDEKADIYSFGVVLSELDTHGKPFANVSNRPTDDVLLPTIADGLVHVCFSDALQEDLWELGESCLQLVPSERPTASELLHQLRQISATIFKE